jgi:ribosomal protein S6
MVTDTKREERLYSYEMVVVISPEVADEQLETAINNITGFITGRGGTISEIKRWGKSTLKISEQVLRHLLIRLDSKRAGKPSAPGA